MRYRVPDTTPIGGAESQGGNSQSSSSSGSYNTNPIYRDDPNQVNRFHENADTDVSDQSTHHTLGILPSQSASGLKFAQHIHSGTLADQTKRLPYGSVDERPRVGCRLRRAVAQVSGTGTINPMSWDTEDEDTHGFIVVPSTTITIPAGQSGLYDIGFNFVITAPIAGRDYISITGTYAVAGVPATMKHGLVDLTEAQQLWTIPNMPLTAGDTFQLNNFQASGANKNISGWMTCYRKGQ